MVLLFLFSVCATSLYTLRCNPRKAGHGKGGVCECLAMPWSVGGGKGTNLTDFILCPNKPVSTFDFRYIYIDTVRHSQVGNMISVCLCTLFSLSLSWNSKIPPLGRIKLKRALFCSALAYMYLCHYGDRIRFGMVKSEMWFPFVFALAFRYICMIKNVVTWILV